MGTRGLVGLIIRGKKHAVYNHWDSYPEGLGQNIVDFIVSLKPEEWDAMVGKLVDIEWVDEQTTPSVELQEYYTQLGYLDLEVGNQSKEDWYCLLRKIQGAAVLPEIQQGKLKHLVEGVTFKTSWCCEWAYFINFEERTLQTSAGGILLHETTFDALVQSTSKSKTWYMESINSLFKEKEEDE